MTAVKPGGFRSWWSLSSMGDGPRVLRDAPDASWAGRAACTGLDPEVFFPTKLAPSSEAAKAICAGCPVREECLQHALAQNEPHGVWGGLTPQERRVLRLAS